MTIRKKILNNFFYKTLQNCFNLSNLKDQYYSGYINSKVTIFLQYRHEKCICVLSFYTIVNVIVFYWRSHYFFFNSTLSEKKKTKIS